MLVIHLALLDTVGTTVCTTGTALGIVGTSLDVVGTDLHAAGTLTSAAVAAKIFYGTCHVSFDLSFLLLPTVFPTCV